MKKIMSVILAFAVTAMCAVPSFATDSAKEIQTDNAVSFVTASAETAEDGEMKHSSEVIEENSEAVVSAQPIESIPLSGVAGTSTDAPKPEPEEITEAVEKTVSEAAEAVEEVDIGEALETAEDIIAKLNLSDEYYDGDFENGEVVDSEEKMSDFEAYLKAVGLALSDGIDHIFLGIVAPFAVPVLSLVFVPVAPFALVLGVGMGAYEVALGIATIVTSPFTPIISDLKS